MKKVLFALVLTVVFALVPYKSMSSVTEDPSIVLLTDKNTLVLNSQVDGESVAKIVVKARELDDKLNKGVGRIVKNKDPLYLVLNTPGGSIQAGLELIESLKSIGRPVNTVTLFAASMGFQIAQNMDTRYIMKNGVLMSHRAKGGFEGEFGGMAPSQIDNRYALWKSRMDELDGQTVTRSAGKQTMDSYQKQYASEMWLTGNQSTAQGYADKVVSVKCDPSLSGSTAHESLIMGTIRVQYDLDNCPTNTSPMNIRMEFATNKGTFLNSDQLATGGSFGPSCLVESGTNKEKVCVLDTSLNLQRIQEIKATFLASFLTRFGDSSKVIDRF